MDAKLCTSPAGPPPAWFDGYRAGHEVGRDRGYASGYAAGRDAGFVEGLAEGQTLAWAAIENAADEGGL